MEVDLPTLSALLNPPIPWRYWLVYYRHPDGRMMFFRGQKRNRLYISNLECGKDGNWTSEEDMARLFKSEPILSFSVIAKHFGDDKRAEIIRQLNYRGFHHTVLQSHLILPHG